MGSHSISEARVKLQLEEQTHGEFGTLEDQLSRTLRHLLHHGCHEQGGSQRHDSDAEPSQISACIEERLGLKHHKHTHRRTHLAIGIPIPTTPPLLALYET